MPRTVMMTSGARPSARSEPRSSLRSIASSGTITTCTNSDPASPIASNDAQGEDGQFSDQVSTLYHRLMDARSERIEQLRGLVATDGLELADDDRSIQVLRLVPSSCRT